MPGNRGEKEPPSNLEHTIREIYDLVHIGWAKFMDERVGENRDKTFYFMLPTHEKTKVLWELSVSNNENIKIYKVSPELSNSSKELPTVMIWDEFSGDKNIFTINTYTSLSHVYEIYEINVFGEIKKSHSSSDPMKDDEKADHIRKAYNFVNEVINLHSNKGSKDNKPLSFENYKKFREQN